MIMWHTYWFAMDTYSG